MVLITIVTGAYNQLTSLGGLTLYEFGGLVRWENIFFGGFSSKPCLITGGYGGLETDTVEQRFFHGIKRVCYMR